MPYETPGLTVFLTPLFKEILSHLGIRLWRNDFDPREIKSEGTLTPSKKTLLMLLMRFRDSCLLDS
jgi:hypothetical protein